VTRLILKTRKLKATPSESPHSPSPSHGPWTSGEKIRIIARGAFLHDIGKMAIPDAILRKPGALTEPETEIMREHCFRGYQMLKKSPSSRRPRRSSIPQERYDGTGTARAEG